MRKFKHTESPWFGKDIHLDTGNVIVKNINSVNICEILSPYKTEGNNSNEEEANLRLIQYSPILLHKLSQIEDLILDVINKKISILDIKIKNELSEISSLLDKIEII